MINAQTTESDFVLKAEGCIDNNDFGQARKYLQQELSNNPKSFPGHTLTGLIYKKEGEYGKAISSFDKALSYAKDVYKKTVSTVYYLRSMSYVQIADTLHAISDLKTSIKLDPESRDAIVNLGDMYFYTRNYKESTAVYKKLLKFDAKDPYPYYGIARNTCFKGDYDKTLDYAMKVQELEWAEPESYNLIMELSDSIYQTVENKLKKQQLMATENKGWAILLGCLYIRYREWSKAIEQLKPVAEGNSEHKFMAVYSMAQCQKELGNDEEVVKLTDQAIAMDSTSVDCYYIRSSARFILQDMAEAERDYKKLMELDKDYGYFSYCQLGWIKRIQKDYAAALRDYDMSIALNDKDSRAYLMKGDLLKDCLGKPEEARQAYLKCIGCDKSIADVLCIQLAYVELGMPDKAIELNDSLLRANDSAYTYYDAACIYSRMGKTDKAIEYLRRSIEKGYRRVRCMAVDYNLNNIRNLPQYQELLKLIATTNKTY